MKFCDKHLHFKTAFQYQREEQTLMLHRAELASVRLGALLAAMMHDPIAPPAHVQALRESLAEHFKDAGYLRCTTMGEIVRQSLDTLRDNINKGLGSLTGAPLNH